MHIRVFLFIEYTNMEFPCANNPGDQGANIYDNYVTVKFDHFLENHEFRLNSCKVSAGQPASSLELSETPDDQRIVHNFKAGRSGSTEVAKYFKDEVLHLGLTVASCGSGDNDPTNLNFAFCGRFKPKELPGVMYPVCFAQGHSKDWLGRHRNNWYVASRADDFKAECAPEFRRQWDRRSVSEFQLSQS